MIYYKVLSAKNRKLYSHLTKITNPYGIRYQIGKWAKPKLKGSKLFVFDSLKAIEEWYPVINRVPWFRIYKCEVKNPTACPKRISYCCPRDIYSWWFYSPKDRCHTFTMNAPKGTIWCDAVKITRKVID